MDTPVCVCPDISSFTTGYRYLPGRPPVLVLYLRIEYIRLCHDKDMGVTPLVGEMREVDPR